MCGITGYLGPKQAAEVLLGGLARLEYRGYDSAGVAIVNGKGNITLKKRVGKVKELKQAAAAIEGDCGIGHTRWATHGEPNERNAHPHIPSDESFSLVHNGIIENFTPLKESLKRKGYSFYSDTDTEVLVKLIEDVQKVASLTLEQAVRQALSQVVGAYGICVCSRDDPDLMIAARLGSPLILGVGQGEWFIASDASAFLEHTRQVVHLNDGEMVSISRNSGYQVSTLKGVELKPEVQELEGTLEQIEKGGYKHFMIKEIMEQPTSLGNCMRGRINVATSSQPASPVRERTGKDYASDGTDGAATPDIRLGGIETFIGPPENRTMLLDRLRNARRFIICGCGTSWHAALVGEYLFESLCKIPVEVEYASEFRYRSVVLRPDEDIVMVISQSGETADTLAALRHAKEAGCITIGICNTVGSTISRETDAGCYLHAGPEIGVASTKAFTAQVMVLAMMAAKIGQGSTIDDKELSEIVRGLAQIPDKIAETIKLNDEIIKEIGKVYRYAHHMLFLGRGYNYPVALEGALKMKEISYIHAEGYPAAEMKHGPIALIDNLMPVVFIATMDSIYEKVKSNIMEVRARKGCVIAITDVGNDELDQFCEYVIKIPTTREELSPILTVIPLQLLSYHIAVMRGCDVDMPRNLAKSVTTE
uniref:Glutamine--fructose-6-phosphate aminotransferase [isomerizing] n=2 Tax=Hemiselmis andersenii TaxID=464988 RepID=A0A7S0TWT2_HEMAN